VSNKKTNLTMPFGKSQRELFCNKSNGAENQKKTVFYPTIVDERVTAYLSDIYLQHIKNQYDSCLSRNRSLFYKKANVS